MKFLLEKFSCWKIFVLKNFRRVDVLRKYFNTKILQHRSREERTERETAIEKFSKGIVFVATTYINKYGRRRLEKRWCAKESTKTLPINTLWLKELLYDIYLESCRGCSLFLRRGGTQSQVRASSASTWNGAQYNSHRCRKKIRCRKYFVRL